ncbi:MAG TPA: hypothetical protein VN848_06875 [Gemmatimonadales bacterium]|nr:hypothetical protein [Gemmatimonadales bacterium]
MRIAILAAALLAAVACTMQTDVPAPSTYIAAQHPSAIWVETKYPTVRLEHPELIGDSITGVRDGRPFSVALSDVAGVTVRQINWPVTDALLATGGLAIVLAVALEHHNPAPCYAIPCAQTVPGQNTCGC